MQIWSCALPQQGPPSCEKNSSPLLFRFGTVRRFPQPEPSRSWMRYDPSLRHPHRTNCVGSASLTRNCRNRCDRCGARSSGITTLYPAAATPSPALGNRPVAPCRIVRLAGAAMRRRLSYQRRMIILRRCCLAVGIASWPSQALS